MGLPCFIAVERRELLLMHLACAKASGAVPASLKGLPSQFLEFSNFNRLGCSSWQQSRQAHDTFSLQMRSLPHELAIYELPCVPSTCPPCTVLESHDAGWNRMMLAAQLEHG
jgi:hypothetical protein